MILVTGGTGFVGSHLVSRLVQKGERVRCLTHRSGAGKLHTPGVEMVPGSVDEPASLASALAGVDTVIHLVAIIRERGAATFEAINHQGTRNLVQATATAGVGRFLHMSALGASPNPRYPYTRSKWLGEQEVVNSGLAYTVFRPSIIFGPEDRFINVLADLIRQSPVIPIIGPGTTRFQPIWVEDVAACIARALDEPAAVGQIIELGGPQVLSYEQIIDTISQVLGVRRLKLHLPLPVMRPVVRLMQTVLPNPPITPGELALLELDNLTGLDSVARHCGLSPRSLEEGIGYVRK